MISKSKQTNNEDVDIRSQQKKESELTIRKGGKSNVKHIEEQQKRLAMNIINLEQDINEGSQKVMYRETKNRNRRGNSKLYGENQTSDGGNDFAAERKVWLYLHRIRKHIKEEDIKNFIQKQEAFTNAAIVVKELSTNDNALQTKCFMFRIDWQCKEEIYMPSTWPKGVAFKRFDFNKFRNYQDKREKDFL